MLPDSAYEFLDRRIRDLGFSLDHRRGNFGIGKVVNSKCKAQNVQGLSAVDACIFPILISAYPRVCLYARAEKDAETIAQSTGGLLT
jgi:hypothetical protein